MNLQTRLRFRLAITDRQRPGNEPRDARFFSAPGERCREFTAFDRRLPGVIAGRQTGSVRLAGGLKRGLHGVAIEPKRTHAGACVLQIQGNSALIMIRFRAIRAVKVTLAREFQPAQIHQSAELLLDLGKVERALEDNSPAQFAARFGVQKRRCNIQCLQMIRVLAPNQNAPRLAGFSKMKERPRSFTRTSSTCALMLI